MWCANCNQTYEGETVCPVCAEQLRQRPMLSWGKSATEGALKNWPRDENGEAVPPAFLAHCSSLDMSDEMLINLLEAYGIPCIRQYPNDGSFGRVIIGLSGTGTEIFVPETLYEDARALMKNDAEPEPEYMIRYLDWLQNPALSDEEVHELERIAGDDKEIESRFYAPLAFGTAGLRGVMGAGLNRMNIHVIRHATQAFAEVIARQGESACQAGVVICFDCRANSREFAQEAACVMAGNGINVRIFDDMRPTPELSFAIRYYKAAAGINITASHNPKEYNGYKVYWSDGAQLPPDHAAAISETMEKLDIFDDIKTSSFDSELSSGRITYIGAETDEAYLEKVLGQAIDRQAVAEAADRIKIVYTPFHGAGYKLVPEALSRLGIKHVIPVDEQMLPDGSFPTVKSPNPENPEGFYLAVAKAEAVGSDLIIGTDPDADRVGVMVRDGAGYIGVTGNQMGVLLIDYIIGARRRAGTLAENAAVIKTIVTTEMARKVCQVNGIYITDTFTGFKYMAEKVAEFEKTGRYEALLSYEESYGYMLGDYVRDKDAVTASLIIAEMAAYYFNRGMTLKNALDELFEKYGYFEEKTIDLVMPGLDGLAKMNEIMERLRAAPPTEIGGLKALRCRDYLSGHITDSEARPVGNTEISGSNVLYFELEGENSFVVRPSGTEPKIKIYLLVSGEGRAECARIIEKMDDFAQTLLT